MSYQLELRHYRYFAMLAEECNFRKAAERLHISQPGLSRQIKLMEDALGIALFIRTNRSVKLTAAGIYLQKELPAIFNQLSNIETHLQFIDKGEMGEVKIAYLGSAMQTVIPQLLLYLKKNFPKIHTTLDEMSNQKQLDLIETNEIDVGFVRVNDIPTSVHKQLVHKDHFTLVVPKDHHLKKTNFKSIDQVKNEFFILFSSDYSPHYFETIISIFHDAGFSPKISHKSVHAQTIFKLVEQGLGIAIIPHSLQYGFDLGVKFLDIPDITQSTTLSAVWSKKNRNPCLKKMLGGLQITEEEK